MHCGIGYNTMNCVRAKRVESGLSQTKLAASVGWSQVRWSHYEIGARKPNVDDARNIVRAFNLAGIQTTLDELFPIESDTGVDDMANI